MIGTGTLGMTVAAVTALSGVSESYLTMSLEVPVSCNGGLSPSLQMLDSGELQLGSIVQRCNVNSQSLLFYDASATNGSVTFLVDGLPISTSGGMIVIGSSAAFTNRPVSLSIDTEGLSDEQVRDVLASLSVTVSQV